MIDPFSPNDSCLFLDIDGTLLDFARLPECVVVPNGLIVDLARIQASLEGAMAFVSGRTLDEVDRLFAPLLFPAAGVHGAELRLRPGAPVLTSDDDRLDGALWEALLRLLHHFPGTWAENKEFAFAIHYRLAPECIAALGPAIEALVAEAFDPNLRILPGHFVVEIKKRSHNKGTAIEALMREPAFKGRTPIFLGDDTTDIPGFETAMRLRGRAYSVGRRISGLSGFFANPESARMWLNSVARQMELSVGPVHIPMSF